MDYGKKYALLIADALANEATIKKGYHEKHHIIPRCIGGLDSPSNIVSLTLRQHFHAHLLLYKIFGKKYPNLIFAVSAVNSITNARKGSWHRKKLQSWVIRSMVRQKHRCAKIKRRKVKRPK